MLSDSFYYTEINGVNYMVYPAGGENCLDEQALNYMLYNDKEFVNFNINKAEGNMLFLYQIPEQMTVYEYITGKLTKGKLMSLISGICEFAVKLGDNGINADCVVWNWNYIYFNPTQNRLLFVLVPSQYTDNCGDEIISLIRYIMSYAVYDLAENCHYVAVILSALNRKKQQSELLAELIKTIKKLTVDTVMRKKKENVTTIDVSNTGKLSSVDIAKKSWGSMMTQTENKYEAEHAPMPCLVRLRTKETIQIYKDSFVIGKDPKKSDYAVTDNSAVSRVHAYIEKKNGVFYIRDNNSSNKTYINGKPIAASDNVLLTSGMVISLADEEFVYKIV